jgi:hypothetical protein
MRTQLLFSLLILMVQNLYSQCYPAFRNMDKQTPSLPNTMIPWPLEEQNSPYTFYYNAYNGQNGRVRYNIWDGKDWTPLKLSYFNNKALLVNFLLVPQLIKWQDQFIACGRNTQVDTLKAGKGKYFGLLAYHTVNNNGKWDTIPGCTFDSAFYFSEAYVADDDLYLHTIDLHDPYKGVIFKYNASESRFVKIIDYAGESNEIRILAGEKRLLISNVARINGMATKGFCYIENDSIKLNTEDPFNTSFIYGMDAATGLIYACMNGDDPIIYEYTDRIVSARATKLDIRTAYKLLYISKGVILLVSHVYNTYGEYYNFLCPQENEWKTIYNKSKTYGGTGDSWGGPNATKDGLFLMNYTTKKIMELVDATTEITTVTHHAPLILYPNPASEHITIQVSGQEMISIYSITGEMIYNSLAKDGQLEIQTNTWPAGLYMVKCGTMYAKFIKTE